MPKTFINNYLYIVLTLFLLGCQEKSVSFDAPHKPILTIKEQQQLIEDLTNGAIIHYLWQERDQYTIYLTNGTAVSLVKDRIPIITKGAYKTWMINGVDTEIPCASNEEQDSFPEITIANGVWCINGQQSAIPIIHQEEEQSITASYIQCLLQTLHHVVFYLYDGTTVVIQHTNNPPIDLTKKELRVLDIGNSYTEDATHYLAAIVQAAKIDVSDMCLYKAIRGGGSYMNWYNIYHDLEQYGYGISKVTGGLSANISSSGYQKDGAAFRSLLTENEWDLIIVHQYSVYAPYYGQWNTTKAGGYLPQLWDLIRAHQPNATIGLLLIHSYWSGYGGNKEHSSLLRWEKIAQSVKQCCEDYNISFIVPYGTAIQNIRSSSFNNEYDLTADGSHCASGLADYTAACCYFQALFAPRYNLSVQANSARWSNTGGEIAKYPSSIIDVTDQNAPIAHQAAILAVEEPYRCINPE